MQNSLPSAAIKLPLRLRDRLARSLLAEISASLMHERLKRSGKRLIKELLWSCVSSAANSADRRTSPTMCRSSREFPSTVRSLSKGGLMPST
jgi:hypothetical protein